MGVNSVPGNGIICTSPVGWLLLPQDPSLFSLLIFHILVRWCSGRTVAVVCFL